MKRLLLSLSLILILVPPSSSFAQTRDPGKIYKVAILPFVIHSQENLDYLRDGIYDILASRLAVEGRIAIIDRTLVERTLYEERPIRLDETVAAKIGKRVDADYVVLGSLTKVGDYISLDARLVSIAEEKPPVGVFTQHKGIDDVMLKIGDFAQEMGNKIAGPVSGRTGPERLDTRRRSIERVDRDSFDFKKSQTLPFEISGLAVGDVDGDKKNEIVVMERSNLYVFKYDGEKLYAPTKIEAGSEHNFLTLDVADVNRNGYAEIVVTSVVEDDLRSFIVEFEEGKFKKITEKAGWFFRVLDHPKDGPILIGQRMSTEGTMEGPIYRMIWKKRGFEPGPKMALPKETRILGFALVNVRNKDKPDVVLWDESERLSVVSADGKPVWTSRDRFGGTVHFYETRKKSEDIYRGVYPPPWRVYVPPRILVRPTGEDGLSEIVINKNETSTTRLFDKLRYFDSGEVHSLVWDQDILATNWKTREIKGYICDYQIKDMDQDGIDELIVAVVDLGTIFERKGSSNILFFQLY